MKVVDVMQRDRLERYKAAALLTTVLVVGAGVLLLMVAAVASSRTAIEQARDATEKARAAVRAGRVTDHNLCVQVNGILRRDRATIRGNPKSSARLLRLLGISRSRVAAFQRAQAPLIAAEVAKRPSLDCRHRAAPKPPKRR